MHSRHSHRRIVIALLLTALLPGCSSGQRAPATPEAKSSRPAKVAPAPAREGRQAIVLAVLTSKRLALYEVQQGMRTVRRVRNLRPPYSPTRPVDVSLTSAADPTVCALWDAAARGEHADTTLVCYAPGDQKGDVVGEAEPGPFAVARDEDGTRLAWDDGIGEGNGTVSVGRLDGTQVVDLSWWPADQDRPPGYASFTGWTVAELAFAGMTPTVVVSGGAQSDDGSGLLLLDTSKPSAEWLGQTLPVPVRFKREGLRVYAEARSADSDSALAILDQNEFWPLDDQAVGSRAVRVDLRTGAVLDIISTPLPGRNVVGVSGGPRGVAYVTRTHVGRDPRFYLRYPGEERGAPLEGLPADTVDVVAAP